MKLFHFSLYKIQVYIDKTQKMQNHIKLKVIYMLRVYMINDVSDPDMRNVMDAVLKAILKPVLWSKSESKVMGVCPNYHIMYSFISIDS